MPDSDRGVVLLFLQQLEEILAEWPPILDRVWIATRPEWTKEHADRMVLGRKALEQRIITSRGIAIRMQKRERLPTTAKIKKRDHRSVLAIVDPIAVPGRYLQATMGLGIQFLPVFFPVPHAQDPLVQPVPDQVPGLTQPVPLKIEFIVTIIVALGIGWMARVGNMADCIDDDLGD